MKKGLRITALAVALCFGSACVFGAENQIRTKITITPDSPIFYENYVAIETPTKGQTIKLHVETKYNDEKILDVRIRSSNGFKTAAPPAIEYENNESKGNIFTLKAPEEAGRYIIVFEGYNYQGALFHFDTEITVVDSDPFQNWLRAGLFIGIALVVTLAIVLASNTGK